MKPHKKAKRKAPRLVKQQLPHRWSESDIRKIIEHYDRQSDAERAKEILEAQSKQRK
jgi:hypothetical protein